LYEHEDDYAYDEFISNLHSEFAADVMVGRDDLFGHVVEKFTTERLQSYYVDHPDVVARALWASGEAKGLIAAHPEASLVFAVTSSEVTVKAGMLKPILHGLVHDEAVAAFVSELVPDQRNDKFRDLLLAILKEYGGVDLFTFKRPRASDNLWKEIQALQTKRNSIVHRADSATPEEAARAIDVADFLLNETFQTVIAKVGLHTHGPLEVCSIVHA
jgi:hypothetical protein